jgi:hypothetical protein
MLNKKIIFYCYKIDKESYVYKVKEVHNIGNIFPGQEWRIGAWCIMDSIVGEDIMTIEESNKIDFSIILLEDDKKHVELSWNLESYPIEIRTPRNDSLSLDDSGAVSSSLDSVSNSIDNVSNSIDDVAKNIHSLSNKKEEDDLS